MKTGWSGLWKDTLTKRLFLLIWVTLLISHVLGFWLGHLGGTPAWQNTLSAVPPVPSMPPLPGMLPDPAGSQARPPGLPPPGLGPDAGPGPGPMPMAGMPFRVRPNLWLDYLVRLIVTGLAAWLGARWLTAPMRRLAQAAESMSLALSRREALPQLNDQAGTLEVRQTAQVFNTMAQQLQSQFEERSLLMAAVSHDLRTPLTRLRIRLERLLPDPHAERCVQDVQDVNSMIEAVLDALNEERRQESAQAIDVLALVQALADDLAEEGQAVTAQGEVATIRVQPVAIKRVLDNLVNNALRYGRQADIRVQRQAGRVRLMVDDQGPGIPDELIEAMFKPFVRQDSSRSRDTGGVGLGLYIARELTVRNGGEIRLRNLPQGGLRAELDFPEAGISA